MSAPRTKTPGTRARSRAAAKRYVRSRRLYVIDFDQPELADLLVKARSVPLGQFLKLVKLAATLGEIGDDGAGFTAAHAQAFEDLFTGFAEALVEWNLDDRGDDEITPVPATLEGAMSQDTDFMMQIIDGWLTAIGGVDAPLGPTSPGGKQSLAASIPMADPSPNP